MTGSEVNINQSPQQVRGDKGKFMDHYMLWLFAGVIFLAAEALGASGIGLFFAGLGALTIGSIVTARPDLAPLSQWIIFFAATALWAILLWKPFQRFRGDGGESPYKNIVGDTAFIGVGGLEAGQIGEATWSGTIMRAELAHNAAPIAPGGAAIITAVSGNTLIVKPK